MADYSVPVPLSRRERRIFSKKRLIIFLSSVIVTVTIAYFVFGNLKAKSHLEEARILANSEDWVGAFMEASRAQQSDPTLEGARLVVKAARLIRSSDVVGRSIQLFEYDGANQEDRTMALEALVDFRQIEPAGKLISQLTAQELKDPKNHFQIFRSALFSGDYTRAIAVANEEIEARNPEIDLMIASSVAESGLKNFKPELNQRLRTVMGQEDSELALRGLELLVLLKPTWVEKTLAEEAIAIFASQEDLKPLLKLHLESLKAQLGQQDLDATVSKAIEDYREGNLTSLVVWLDRLGRDREIVELTSDPEAQKEEIIYLVRLSALENEKRWGELQAALEEGVVEIPEPLKLARLAMVYTFLDKGQQASTSWDLALIKANADERRNWFYQISQIAGRAGNVDVQMEALTRAITRPYGITPPSNLLDALYNWLGDNNDKARILEVSNQLLKRQPRQPMMLNHQLYFKALYQTVDETDLEKVQKLVDVYPTNLTFRRCLSFVLFKLGKFQEAFDALSELPSDAAVDNLVRALRSRTLFALGYDLGARDLASRVDWSELTPDERMELRLPLPKEILEGALYQSAQSDDLESLEKLVQTYPQSSIFRRSLALAQVKLKLYPEAYATLRRLPPEEETENLTLALRARVLFALDQVAEAHEIAMKVDLGKLTDEERELLELPLVKEVREALERVSSLEEAKNWTELATALDALPQDFPKSLKLAYQAVVEVSKNQQGEAAAHWWEAMTAAQSNRERNWFYTISELAGRADNEEIKNEALARALARGDGKLPSLTVIRSLYHWLNQKSDERRLLDVSRSLAQREGNNLSIQSDFLYYKALYQEAEASDAKRLEQLVQESPERRELRRRLAFVELRLQKYQEALETLSALPDQGGFDHLANAIRARALFRTLQQSKAREIDGSIDWSKLTEKEVTLLKLPETEAVFEGLVTQRVKSNDVESLRDALEAYPKNLSFRCWLAFVELKTGNAQSALGTLRDVDPRAESDPFVLAIRARAYFDNGQEKIARDMARRVDWAKLPASEREFLELPEPEEEKK